MIFAVNRSVERMFYRGANLYPQVSAVLRGVEIAGLDTIFALFETA